MVTVASKGNEICVRCPEPNCSLKSKGCDIEPAYDEESEPIWAISYECPEGHKFIAEFERMVEDESERTA